MSLVRDLVLRYSLSRQQQRFTRIVAWISTLGMALGVACLITVMSIMNGFSAELHQRILSLVAHARVEADTGPLADWAALAPKLRAVPGVHGLAPVIEETVLLRAWGRNRGVLLTGIDPSAHREVNDLHRRMVAGTDADLADAPFTVVIGATLSQLLGIQVGDNVDVTLPKLTVTPLGVFPRERALRVVGVFEVGADPDANQIYVSLETAQRLLARDGVDAIELRLTNPDAVTRVIPAVEALLPAGFRVVDWRSSQGSLFTAVRMEKITVSLLLLSVVAVAAFNIISTLTMAVTEKRGDIAVLRVMGAPAGDILRVFLGYGLLLGLIGIATGTVLGVLLALTVSDLAAAIEGLLGVALFDPTVYYIGRLPSQLAWADVAVTVLAATLLSLAATAYPAWRASRVDPVEVLNHV